MDENEDIQMAKKRLLVDTIEGRKKGKIFVEKCEEREKRKPRYGFSGFINSRVN